VYQSLSWRIRPRLQAPGPNREACTLDDVVDGRMICQITNTLDEVTSTVNKEWIVSGLGEEEEGYSGCKRTGPRAAHLVDAGRGSGWVPPPAVIF
jgi:hypothetical protein